MYVTLFVIASFNLLFPNPEDLYCGSRFSNGLFLREIEYNV